MAVKVDCVYGVERADRWYVCMHLFFWPSTSPSHRVPTTLSPPTYYHPPPAHHHLTTYPLPSHHLLTTWWYAHSAPATWYHQSHCDTIRATV